MSLLYACMNSHAQHYINALALSVMVGELMGGALGMPLVGPTHRYAGITPHLTPRPSPALRHTARTRRPYVGSYKGHTVEFCKPRAPMRACEGTSSWY